MRPCLHRRTRRGYNAYEYDQAVASGSLEASQSWYAGLQWDKAFADADSLGFAVGQPVFATSLTGDATPQHGNDAFDL